MKIIKEQHTYYDTGIYAMQQLPGDIDTIYEMSADEFETADLPDSDYYSVAANDYFRSKISFAEWEDPHDCKFVGFRVVGGKKCDFEEIPPSEFRARSANRVKIIGQEYARK